LCIQGISGFRNPRQTSLFPRNRSAQQNFKGIPEIQGFRGFRGDLRVHFYTNWQNFRKISEKNWKFQIDTFALFFFFRLLSCSIILALRKIEKPRKPKMTYFGIWLLHFHNFFDFRGGFRDFRLRRGD
jgi:hypothetical protein